MVKDIICLLLGIIFSILIGKYSYNQAKKKDMMQIQLYGVFVFCIIMVILCTCMLIRLILQLIC